MNENVLRWLKTLFEFAANIIYRLHFFVPGKEGNKP